MSALTKASAAIAKGLAAARADLDQIRDRIGDLQSERQTVATAPCDRAEAEQRVAGIIDQARARELFNRSGLFGPEGGRLDDFFVERLRREPLAALAAVYPDQLAAAFLEHHPGGGMSADARAARLKEIERSLLACEIAEEAACREIEAATGGTIPRRLDANMAVLLATDMELEGEA